MRRRRSVDPDAARRLARQSLTRLARLRDATGHDIHETAQAAYDTGLLTWAEIGECLGMTSGGAHYIAHHGDPDGT